MGTRFALTAESPVHERVVRLLLAASESDTLVTDRVDGLPGRLFAGGRREIHHCVVPLNVAQSPLPALSASLELTSRPSPPCGVNYF
jgi:hypothetical protein